MAAAAAAASPVPAAAASTAPSAGNRLANPRRSVIAGAAFTQNVVDLSGGKNAGAAPASKDKDHVDPPNFFVLVSETSLYAGGPNQNGSVDGMALNARFNTPSDIVVNKYQELFIADTDNASIRRISKQGQVSAIAAIGGGDGEIDNCQEQHTSRKRMETRSEERGH